MTNRSESTTILGALLSAAIAILGIGALAQAPTQAQRNAIKSQCRSDYIAHCSSVKPGGIEALQCLQTNMARLSPVCQTAVRAVETPAPAKAEAAPKAEPAPAAATNSETAAPPSPAPTAEPAPAAAVTTPATPATTASRPAAPAAAARPTANPTAGRPSEAQIAAIRSACRSDYPAVCAGVPTGGAQALQCLQKNRARVSARCQQALNATGGSAATAATAPAAAPARPLVLRPMRPREVAFVLRSACGADVRTLCAGIDPGGGRVLQCLTTNASSLSPACRRVLSQFAAR